MYSFSDQFSAHMYACGKRKYQERQSLIEMVHGEGGVENVCPSEI